MHAIQYGVPGSSTTAADLAPDGKTWFQNRSRVVECEESLSFESTIEMPSQTPEPDSPVRVFRVVDGELFAVLPGAPPIDA